MMIKVAARDSNLSKAQVEEFKKKLVQIDPSIEIHPVFMKSYGDKNHNISLRESGYDDLFTKEIDEAVLRGDADLALHSAKDIPETLSEELEMYYLSQSIHPSDALVIKDGYSIDRIPKNGIIMASSFRREEHIKKLRQDFICRDVRGAIEQRLAYLNNPEVYGVVVAEAAIIRLKLVHLNRILLDGETHPKQGMLAALGLKSNHHLRQLIGRLN